MHFGWVELNHSSKYIFMHAYMRLHIHMYIHMYPMFYTRTDPIARNIFFYVSQNISGFNVSSTFLVQIFITDSFNHTKYFPFPFKVVFPDSKVF